MREDLDEIKVRQILISPGGFLRIVVHADQNEVLLFEYFVKELICVPMTNVRERVELFVIVQCVTSCKLLLFANPLFFGKPLKSGQ